MNRKQRNRILAVIGIVLVAIIAAFLFRLTLICCALPPNTTATAIVALNQTIDGQIQQTQTSTFQTAISLVFTPTPSSYPYDPTLYAQRRHEEQILQTAAGPDDYATFYAEETALVATYQRTIIPTKTPLPYDPTLYAQRRHEEQLLQTGAGPTQYAIFFATETALVATYQGTLLTTSTPISYTADMSPTIVPRFNTRTATPTLCPPSDVICPGGNATMSAADKVMLLMASASAPEFGQLAQTATALAITPTPTPTSSVHDSNCAFSWAHQDLPDIATAAREALSTISMAKIQVLRADAYGENCNRADGSLSYFAAMTTDFYLSVDVSDLSDANQLAQIVKTAYTVLTELKVKLPARAGYLDIVFSSGEQQKRFRAMFSQIKPVIESGKSAVELLTVGKM